MAKHRPAMAKKYRGPVRLVDRELKKRFRADDVVFVCSCNDLFANGVPSDMARVVIDAAKMSNATFLWQTKNPDNIIPHVYSLPEKSIIGTTYESNLNWYGAKPSPVERMDGMMTIARLSPRLKRMVTMEPIKDFILDQVLNDMGRVSPEWINIGAETKGGTTEVAPEPAPSRVARLIKELRAAGFEVREKSNLSRLTGSV